MNLKISVFVFRRRRKAHQSDINSYCASSRGQYYDDLYISNNHRIPRLNMYSTHTTYNNKNQVRDLVNLKEMTRMVYNSVIFLEESIYLTMLST